MKEIPLADYLRCKGTQPQLAKAVGVTQSAICQMAKSSRDIRVRILESGLLELIEFRILNKTPASQASDPSTMPVTIPATCHQNQSSEVAGFLSSSGGAQ